MPYLPNDSYESMLEHIGSNGLVLITPWSATVIRTKYELHSFVVSLLIAFNYLDRRKNLSCINDNLSANCALSELLFAV